MRNTEMEALFKMTITGDYNKNHNHPTLSSFQSPIHPSQHSFVSPFSPNRSIFSVVGYLNGRPSFGGGETIMYSGDRIAGSILGVAIPEPGRCLVFTHDLFHEGTPVLGGQNATKLIFRSDIMFR